MHRSTASLLVLSMRDAGVTLLFPLPILYLLPKQHERRITILHFPLQAFPFRRLRIIHPHTQSSMPSHLKSTPPKPPLHFPSPLSPLPSPLSPLPNPPLRLSNLNLQNRILPLRPHTNRQTPQPQTPNSHSPQQDASPNPSNY